MVTFNLYLLEQGEQELIASSTDPLHIRRIATGRSFTKRASRFGRSVLITKDNKRLQGGATALDNLCYERWLEANAPDQQQTNL